MPITPTFLIPLTIAGALACLPMLVGSTSAMPIQRVAPQTATAGFQPVHDVRRHRRPVHHAARHERVPTSDGLSEDVIPDGHDRAGDYRAHATGDTSGFPGGNEFDPTAPFGGQAAVTAPIGSDAYKEQMIQRRYFCEYASNRC